MKRIILAGVLAGLMALSPLAARGGPISESETRLAAVYALYRNALFTTNQKDPLAARRDLRAFSDQWRSLATTWERTPPPQYADDQKLAVTLANVSAAIATADAKLEQGDLPGGHDVLERVRDELGALRARNGITNFSDEMNAYHEVMEHVLQRFMPTIAQIEMGDLREQAAVLAYLAAGLGKYVPADIRNNPQFEGGLKEVRTSVDVLRAAARAGDHDRVRKALEGLKRPYSMFFLKFG